MADKKLVKGSMHADETHAKEMLAAILSGADKKNGHIKPPVNGKRLSSVWIDVDEGSPDGEFAAEVLVGWLRQQGIAQQENTAVVLRDGGFFCGLTNELNHYRRLSVGSSSV